MRDYKVSGRRRGGTPRLRDRMWPRRNKSTIPKGFQALKAPVPTRRTREQPGPGLLWRLPLARLSTKPLRALYALALLWLVGGTLAMLPGLWQHPLRHVTLLGREALSEAEVLATAGFRPGMTLMGLDVFAATQALAAHPRIVQAELRRWVPGSITVQIVERRPLYRSETSHGTVLLDAQHVVLPVSQQGPAPEGLRNIRGLHGPPLPGRVLQEPGLMRAAEVYHALERQAALQELEAVVDVGDPLRTTLLLPARRTTLLLPDGGLPEALAAYAALAPHLPLPRGEALRELDLRLLFDDGRIIARVAR